MPGGIWSLDFERETAIGAFNGVNGSLTEVMGPVELAGGDPIDPAYRAAVGPPSGIGHLVSFGEDNAGNLYLVDFGDGTGFQGQYPRAGLGEIFRLTPVPEPGMAAAAIGISPLLMPRWWR